MSTIDRSGDVLGVGLNGEFERVARRIPGFAGVFHEEGRLIVTGTNRQNLESQSDHIRSRFGSSEPIEYREVDHSFRELFAVMHALRRRGYPEGVTAVDVDEYRNRVRIGYDPEHPEVETTIRTALEATGAPSELVELVPVSAPVPTQSLQDVWRPTVGGIQVEAEGWPPCTMWNISGPAINWDRGIITASHCSGEFGVADRKVLYQKTQDYGAMRIGLEEKDPALRGYTDNWYRYSDALLGLYDDSISARRGYIARPASKDRRDGPIEPMAGEFEITAQFSGPTHGMILNKVGRTTGWTWGDVEWTCSDVPIEEPSTGNTYWVICADRVDAGCWGGDSGSPVFRELGGHSVGIYGILFAGTDYSWQLGVFKNFWMSGMDQIERDLGDVWAVRFKADIYGPSTITSTGEWAAKPDGGYGPHTFRWYRDGNLVSTDSVYSGTFFFDFDLRLEVEDNAGWFDSDQQRVFVSGIGDPEDPGEWPN